ncbi:hypothetical protein WJR50_32110 [Catalinimonas sp. 4WD22]|uniref:hypothetical protein n=1 Tax=Catalinimonas locisalis TaxID=3133978 RepID=UPI0031011BCC
MPVVLGLTLHIFRKIHPGKEKYRFEWLLPNRSSVYTRDIWDIFFYAIGGVLFYFTMNKEGR